ncbi:MAG: hypothetical protein JOY99_15985 [Sphingomonadaceae bacterium]|nr:hypothetical protein [Sphingomonadaceae bacterium]
MFDRREILVGGAALGLLPIAARAALPVPAGNRLGFDVLLKGSKLGTHVLTFEPRGDGLSVHVAVDLVYKLAGITFYHYKHRATETWSGDQVVGLDATTDDNGTAYQVAVRRDASGLVVTGNKTPRYVAPADAMPATHWNRRELEGPWINTETGAIARPKITPLGVDTIPTANGTTRARHFALTGDVQMDMWYDDARWAGIAFSKGGRDVRYVRQA